MAELKVSMSLQVLAVAAAGYMLSEELADPIIDVSVRALYRGRLDDAVRALSTDERVLLAREADLNAAAGSSIPGDTP